MLIACVSGALGARTAGPSNLHDEAAARATGCGPGDQAARWPRRIWTRDGADRAEKLILRARPYGRYLVGARATSSARETCPFR